MKVNPKWLTELNVKPETIKLLNENIREDLRDLELGKDCLGITIKA